ncbi:hypothetical protein SLS62_006381 [Diatrype stigma]|uniref:Tetratricopeptide repeat protein 15 n=1 Tax=Diatrype stigma TaxID=117547 RepID=A0AAN9USX7_9PEZI
MYAPPLSPQVAAARLSSSSRSASRPASPHVIAAGVGSTLRRIGSPAIRSGSPAPAPARPPSAAASSPASSSARTTATMAAKERDFSYLLKPEIYHPLSALTIPAPFRAAGRQPAPETPLATLLATGHFRAAAIAAVQALTSPPPLGPAPTDHARIFELLYARLACLCLMDATPLAAQEAKALEDLSSAYYYVNVDVEGDGDGEGAQQQQQQHLVPWPLRLLGVRLQAIGFGDPRRAVMSYYELAREARAEVARAARSRDPSAAELWKARLADLGVRVAGALVEMDDLAGAAEHLATLGRGRDALGVGGGGGGVADGGGRLAMSRALMWLHLGDVEAARRCVSGDGDGDGDGGGGGGETMAAKVVDALADMADGEYESALRRWKALRAEMEEDGVHDEMVGVNLAGRDTLEGLIEEGYASHTLLFNLTTMYELATDRAKNLKMHLAERVAALEPSAQGWEKTNADFKL